VPEPAGAIGIVGRKLDKWRGHGRSMAGARACFSSARKAAATDGRALGSDEARGWAVPGSNERPPTCKGRASAAVYCRLSLSPLGERGSAHSCCALLRFVASTALPHDPPTFTRDRQGYSGCCACPTRQRRAISAALTLGRLMCVHPQRCTPSPRLKEPDMSISTPERLPSRLTDPADRTPHESHSRGAP
jgi:hypothetical protein